MGQLYYGTKQLKASIMTLGDYNSLRGWDMPENEDPNSQGYLVEYMDGGKSNHPDYENYISWSPKDVFEKSYQPTDAMSFGHAIEALKSGKKVSRSGWNGRGMFLVLIEGTKNAQLRDGTPYQEATGLEECEILPHIDMWTVNSSGRQAMLCGWAASVTDVLSNDWCIVE